MLEIDRQALREAARAAAGGSYSPYSRFRVGAALLCTDGSVVTGANVENRSYGLTCCAERSAIFAAVCSGKRRFLALAVFTPDSQEAVPPCGACRQVISEFAGPELPVLYAGSKSQEERTLGELYPFDSLHDLNKS
jgi:cytidine deaminase